MPKTDTVKQHIKPPMSFQRKQNRNGETKEHRPARKMNALNSLTGLTNHSDTQSSQKMCLQRSRTGVCIFSWHMAHISPAAFTCVKSFTGKQSYTVYTTELT